MAKRSKSGTLKEAARILGKLGGTARRKILTAGRRSEIASQGGKAKANKSKEK